MRGHFGLDGLRRKKSNWKWLSLQNYGNNQLKDLGNHISIVHIAFTLFSNTLMYLMSVGKMVQKRNILINATKLALRN